MLFFFWKCHINCRKKIGTFIHTDTFTHRSFYTETLSHTETFTHRSFHTQTLLHTDIFNHRHFYTHTHAFLLHTATLSHTEAFIRKILSLQTLEISRYLCCPFFPFFLHFFVFFLSFVSFYCHFGNGKMVKKSFVTSCSRPFVTSWHQIQGISVETLGKPAGSEEE